MNEYLKKEIPVTGQFRVLHLNHILHLVEKPVLDVLVSEGRYHLLFMKYTALL